MDKFELQKLRDLPIEGVAERLGLRVTRHKCLCPFHDDHHASMSFKVSKNTFRCFVCGASGGVIDLVMRYLGKDFVEACRWLGAPSILPQLGEVIPASEASPSGGRWEGARYARFFEHPFLNDDARQFLYDERRLDPRVVAWCRLTSWKDRQGVPWLQIPYYNKEGKLIGVQNRNLIKGALPRFRFPQGSQCSIYNLPVLNLLKPGDELYITEGASDCWSLLSAGHKAIAIPSATLLTKKDEELLQTLDSSPNGGRLGGGFSFHMFPDRDEPGERLFLQLQKVLPTLVHHQLPPDCKDFSDYYLKLKRD
jgi:DNA primase